jgi:hypothetical protein
MGRLPVVDERRQLAIIQRRLLILSDDEVADFTRTGTVVAGSGGNAVALIGWCDAEQCIGRLDTT